MASRGTKTTGTARAVKGAPEAGTRERLLTAAAGEFAARGFAGASVDRIALSARVNKAMIYYHFASKAALYQEILGDMFAAVGTRIRSVAASDASPSAKLARFVEAIADEAEARPHFPPIWFREIAEEGAHLEEGTLREMAGIVQTLAGFSAKGPGRASSGASTPSSSTPASSDRCSSSLRAQAYGGGSSVPGCLARGRSRAIWSSPTYSA